MFLLTYSLYWLQLIGQYKINKGNNKRELQQQSSKNQVIINNRIIIKHKETITRISKTTKTPTPKTTQIQITTPTIMSTTTIIINPTTIIISIMANKGTISQYI